MPDIQLLYLGLRTAWRTLFPGEFERGCMNALVYLVLLYVAVLVVERIHGTRTHNYRSREFAHDVAYYVYYRSGAHRILFTAAFFLMLDAPLSFLDLRLLAPLPIVLQVILGVLIADLSMYWLHRAQHHFRFLWAFHSTTPCNGATDLRHVPALPPGRGIHRRIRYLCRIAHPRL
jgi:hypothetical protein